MVAFQELLPTAGGIQLMDEYGALKLIMDNPRRPCVYILGGAKISDAFGMMRKVLADGSADTILAAGVTGLVMHLARGADLGPAVATFLKDRALDVFIPEAKALLAEFGDRYILPLDMAYAVEGEGAHSPGAAVTRAEAPIADLPRDRLFPDIGHGTIAVFKKIIAEAGSVFVNGPAGMYENPLWADGTREVWSAIADAPGYTVIGGGDTISAAAKFTDMGKYGYVCTGGGAMVRFLAGKRLPLIEAMEKAGDREIPASLLR
jgi:phosphoglycerate kinase